MDFSSSTLSGFPNKVNVEQVDNISNANPDWIRKLSFHLTGLWSRYDDAGR